MNATLDRGLTTKRIKLPKIVARVPELWKHQREAIQALLTAYQERKCKAMMVVLGTGMGKTGVACSVLRELSKMKVLILVHSDEICRQWVAALALWCDGFRVQVEMAEEWATGDCDVVVASVQTLSQANRLERFDPSEFGLVVVDECHHAVAESWSQLLEFFGAGTRIPLVGLTATPNRSDRVGLDVWFKEIVYTLDLITGLRQRNPFLANWVAYRIEGQADLTTLSVGSGDFNVSELSAIVNNDTRNALALRAYQEHLSGKRAIIFCASAPHTSDIQAMLLEAGIPAASITEKTDKKERRALLRAFREGRIHVLCAYNCLTEGFDEPRVEGIILMRPTKSKLLLLQMLGRGFRVHPGKEKVTIIDIVDICGQHDIATVPSLFGLPRKWNPKPVKPVVSLPPEVDENEEEDVVEAVEAEEYAVVDEDHAEASDDLDEAPDGSYTMDDIEGEERKIEEILSGRDGDRKAILDAVSIEDAKRLLVEFDLIGRSKYCSVDGCGRKRETSIGLCGAHWIRHTKGIDLSIPVRKFNQQCGVAGCDRKARGHGFCDTHYQRFRNGTDLTAPIRKPHTGNCSVDGCTINAVLKGFCRNHYHRSLKGMDLSKPFRKTGNRNTGNCSANNCNHDAVSNGFCRNHYNQDWKKNRNQRHEEGASHE